MESTRQIQITIERVEVKAKPRRLGKMKRIRRRGKKLCYFKPLRWEVEMAPMVHWHHPDLPDELEKLLTEQICAGL